MTDNSGVAATGDDIGGTVGHEYTINFQEFGETNGKPDSRCALLPDRSSLSDPLISSRTIVRPSDARALSESWRSDLEWQSFIRLVNMLSRLSDSTTTGSNRIGGRQETPAPRIGDIAYCVACVVSRLGEPNENTITRDLFTMSVRDFTERYLTELSERCDLTERQRIYSLKIWLTCRVHFDRQLLHEMRELNNGGGGDGATQTAKYDRTKRVMSNKAKRNEALEIPDLTLERSLRDAVSGRLVFEDTSSLPRRNDDATLSRLESFSPTFALYTLCNLRDVYSGSILRDRNRFDLNYDPLENYQTSSTPTAFASPSSSSSLSLVEGRQQQRHQHDYLQVRARANMHGGRGGAVHADDDADDHDDIIWSNRIGRPPSKRNWFSLCQTKRPAIGARHDRSLSVASNDTIWYTQCLLVNARESINRDKTLFRYIEAAVNESSNRDSCRGTSTTGGDTAVVVTSMEPAVAVGPTTSTGSNTFPGIKMFAKHQLYEEEFGRVRSNLFDRLNATNGFTLYLEVLDGVSVAWAKLNVFEPTVFV